MVSSEINVCRLLLFELAKAKVPPRVVVLKVQRSIQLVQPPRLGLARVEEGGRDESNPSRIPKAAGVRLKSPSEAVEDCGLE